MCGICGIFNFSQKNVEKKEVVKICRTLEHRGPDDEGYYISKNIGLGNRRLSIIDLRGGHQPIHNEDKTLWITFNGEIYNFLELREDLSKSGHRFYTKTDTEVIVHLYEEYGEKCFEKLDGMFAVGIFDEKRNQLLLARDPIGEKPLFWTIFNQKFVFASEIKGLLAYPGFVREIEKDSLAKYFLYGFIPSPECIFKGIRKILPGNFLMVDNKGTIKEKKYWEFDYAKKISDVDNDEIENKIETLLIDSVEKRLISDVPLGVCLSGGVDSSLVAALMAKKMDPEKVKAFTIGFKEKSYDESIYARLVAKHLGIKHYLKIFSQDDLLPLLPKIAEILDEPMADPSILPTFLLSSFVKQHVKVALSGDGGDENFGGYPKYLAHWFLERTGLKILPFPSAVAHQLGKSGTFLRYMSYPLHLRNQLWINHFTIDEVEQLTGIKADFSDIEKYHKIFNGKEVLDEALFIDQKLTLADLYLVKTDRVSMANGLEIRCPFLAKSLLELCATIPFGVKLKNFRTKFLLKEIALKYLPREAIFRKKRGFGIPLNNWLTNEFRQTVYNKFLKNKNGILDLKQVERVVNKGTDHQVWSLLAFNLWKEKWLRS